MKNMSIKNVYGRKTTKANKSAAPTTLDKRLAEIREYNQIHGTHLSYGQYSVMFCHK